MLTDAKVKNLKPKEKRYKVLDGNGIYIIVYPSGKKVISQRRTIVKNGKRYDTERVLGEYPALTLAKARLMDSGAFKARPLTFGELYAEWFERWKESKRDSTITNINVVSKLHLLPIFGNIPVKELSPHIVLTELEKIPSATASICLGIIGRILKLGVATERAENDFTPALRPFLPKQQIKHYYTPKNDDEIKELLNAIYKKKPSISKYAILFQMFTLTRVSEAVGAKWNEINGDVWTIPKERMKMHKEHVIPLSRQAIEILEKVRGKSNIYVFPSFKNHISRFSIREYMRKIRKDFCENMQEFTPHSFRGMASTVLHEHGFDHALIEMSLAHQPKDIVSASYNHALLLGKRKEMLQWYADYLENLL